MSLDRIGRHPERGSADRAKLDALLDAEWWGTFATVTPDGQPWVVPLLYARDSDRLLLHGSTGAGALRRAAHGAPVAFTVTAMDALVFGYSAFDSSANYRSAVVRGTAKALDGEDKRAGLDVLTDRILPGRMAEVRPHTGKELAATLLLSIPLAEGSWLYKERTGQASMPEEATDAWGGIIPLATVAGAPVTAPWAAGRPVPTSAHGIADGYGVPSA